MLQMLRDGGVEDKRPKRVPSDFSSAPLFETWPRLSLHRDFGLSCAMCSRRQDRLLYRVTQLLIASFLVTSPLDQVPG